MWYIGTKSKCEAYNEKVSRELGFNGSITSRWASIRKHPSKSQFAIVAHPDIVAGEMKEAETLTDDWYETDES